MFAGRIGVSFVFEHAQARRRLARGGDTRRRATSFGDVGGGEEHVEELPTGGKHDVRRTRVHVVAQGFQGLGGKLKLSGRGWEAAAFLPVIGLILIVDLVLAPAAADQSLADRRRLCRPRRWIG